MKLNVKKLLAMMLALTLVFSMEVCGNNDGNTGDNASSGGNTTGGANPCTITKYIVDNKDTISAGMVNQVMFAHSDTLAIVTTVLTLDSSAMTYVLTKEIATEKILKTIWAK